MPDGVAMSVQYRQRAICAFRLHDFAVRILQISQIDSQSCGRNLRRMGSNSRVDSSPLLAGRKSVAKLSSPMATQRRGCTDLKLCDVIVHAKPLGVDNGCVMGGPKVMNSYSERAELLLLLLQFCDLFSSLGSASECLEKSWSVSYIYRVTTYDSGP
jgi:hypothetical protein